ncbi:MAG: hypothetical protein KME20_18230 [Kaiparowitsia implicata GSE-PSE-MK54-09C]|nr:hypothetical protein [Kaiparowitsia implicata GSE-PSE-MK54-09C]
MPQPRPTHPLRRRRRKFHPALFALLALLSALLVWRQTRTRNDEAEPTSLRQPTQCLGRSPHSVSSVNGPSKPCNFRADQRCVSMVKIR